MRKNNQWYDVRPIDLTPFYARFPDNQSCIDHLTTWRYGEHLEKLHCLRCENKGPQNFYIYLNTVGDHNPFNIWNIYECKKCHYHQVAVSSTIFHNSKLALQKSYLLVWLFRQKPTPTYHNIQRCTGVKPNTCTRFHNRLAAALFRPADRELIEAIVHEVEGE